MIGARTVVALAAAVASIMLTASLGNWQLRRADEKLALQTQWDSAMQAAPLPVDGAGIAAVSRNLPQRVRVHGSVPELRQGGPDVGLIALVHPR